MNTTYCGIDNGVSGSFAVIYPDRVSEFRPMPTFSEQNYQKKAKNITRIHFETLFAWLRTIDRKTDESIDRWVVVIERPMVNPGRFQATCSAVRCLESVLIAVGYTDAVRRFVDSKEWQKVMLPKNVTKEALKTASAQIGCRMFPKLRDAIIKHGDADSLLMAEWARQTKI